MKELKELILQGESDTLDFKKRITKPERIARTLASFANTRGGIVLVGVMDSGYISGIDPEEEKHLLNQAAHDYCNPPVRLVYREVEDEGKTVLKVIIPESAEKPHLVKVNENDWRGYIRVKDETVQTSGRTEEVPEMEVHQELFPDFALEEKVLLEFLARNNRITLKQYMELGKISRQNAYHILVRLVLLGVIRLHQKDEKEDYYTLKKPAGSTRT